MAGSFEIDIARFGANTQQKMDATVRHIMLSLLSGVVQNSPVGDPSRWQSPNSAPPGYTGGHFRGNWQVGLETMPTSEVDTTDQDGSRTVSDGMAKVPLVRAFGRVYYIVNNTPYAQALEDGHSSIAPGPQAIMGRTLLNFDQIVRDAAQQANP